MAYDPHDPLTLYFKDLTDHELLTHEQECAMSREIEECEVATWGELLGNVDNIKEVLGYANGKLTPAVRTTNLVKIVDEMLRSKRARKDPKVVARLNRATTKVSKVLRQADLDRTLLDDLLAQYGSELVGARQLHNKSARLRNEFVRANLRLVVTMARRYDRGGMPLSDLIQEGNLGLMHAVARFDYRRGLRFSTYACWWIRHAIGRALADKARAVRVPVHMLEAQQQLEKARRKLVKELGRAPETEELANAAGFTVAKVEQMYKYTTGQAVSLDMPAHKQHDMQPSYAHPTTHADMLVDPSSETMEEDLAMQGLLSDLKDMMHVLTPVEADVIACRFGLEDDEERTFREIGEMYKLSRERIRQIQNTALAKLKRALEMTHRGPVRFTP